MQRTGELATSMRDNASSARALSPPRAFVVLSTLILVVAALGALASGETRAPIARTSIPPTREFALSDAEAIARFKELNARLMLAYRERDASLVSTFLTSGSPLRHVAFEDIRMMNDRDILFRPRQKLLRVVVSENTSSSITVRTVVRQNGGFVTEDGEDATVNRGPMILVARWVMHKEDGAWWIHDSKRVGVRRLPR